MLNPKDFGLLKNNVVTKKQLKQIFVWVQMESNNIFKEVFFFKFNSKTSFVFKFFYWTYVSLLTKV